MPEAVPPTEVMMSDEPEAPVLTLFRPERTRAPAPRPEVLVERYPKPLEPHPDLVVLDAPGSAAAARFRALRHRMGERGDPRVVLVTSPAGGEGKSFTAANLALTLAELRRYRVLLVEGHVRRPALAARFGLARGEHACLHAQLEEHRRTPDAPWTVTAVGAWDLHLLAVSAAAPRARLLEGPVFVAALDRFRPMYDYIIIDGPPVLGGPEVNLVEDAVDALLMVARAGQSRGKVLQSALEQVSPSDVLGVVLVGA